MCFEIIYKWTIPVVNGVYPPMIINLTIDMFLGFGKIVLILILEKWIIIRLRIIRKHLI